MFLTKYAVARHFYIPMIKRNVMDYAVAADWTPAAGDVKVSLNGVAPGATNITTLPVAVVMGNTALWDFSLTAAELTAAQVIVTVADAATKAVEDQSFYIETYGNAAAIHAFDLDTASVAQTGDAYAVANTRLPAALVSGRIDASVGAVAASAITAAAIATDAIGSAQLAATAVTEIQTGLATAAAVAALPTVASITALQTDIDNIQTRLPAALVGGRMDSNVGTFTTGAITTLAFTAGAIDAAAIATDAIGSAELAATAVTKIQTGLPTVASITALQADTDDIQARLPSALVGGKMESNVGSMTTDVITAAALAAGAVTEIQTGLATSASIAALPTAASIAALQADTDNIQTRLPAALVGGRMDSSVGAMAADVVNASALATDAVTEIQTGLVTAGSMAVAQADLDNIQTRLPAALVGGRMDSTVGAVISGAITSAGFAADAINANALAADAGAEIAGAVWDVDATGHQTAGTFGKAIGDPGVDTYTIYGNVGQIKADTDVIVMLTETYLDAKVSSRLAPTTAGRTLDVSVGGEAGIDWANIGSADFTINLSGTVIGLASNIGFGGINQYTIANGAFTAAKFATGAIDANALATDAVDEIQNGLLKPTVAGRTLDVSATGEAGLDWANIGSPLTSVSLNATGINSVNIVGEVAVLSAGAIDNVAMGPDSISASALSAGAVAEIADAVWEEILTDHISVPDSAGWVVNENIRANVEGITYTTAAINDDTDNIQNRLPVALIGGRMDSSVGAVAVTTNLGFSVPAIGRGMVDAGATVTDLPTAEFAPGGGSVDQFVGRVVLFDADTVTVGLRGCARPISASTLASLPTLTVDILPTLPAAGDTFSVV